MTTGGSSTNLRIKVVGSRKWTEQDELCFTADWEVTPRAKYISILLFRYFPLNVQFLGRNPTCLYIAPFDNP